MPFPYVALNSQQILDAYEADRALLPSAQFPLQTQRAADLSTLADHYDAFLFDAFGVLNLGETALPGAAERLDLLRAAGKTVCMVSNAAGVPQAALWTKYQHMGFGFAPQDIVSSRQALLAHLAALPPQRWAVMAPPNSDLSDLQATLGDAPVVLGDEPGAYQYAEGFILMSSQAWTTPRQHHLTQALQKKMRPVLVGNSDLVAPREAGFSLEPGHFARDLMRSTRTSPVFFGKPYAGVFELALQRLPAHTPRHKVLMVGDTLHTDILGGRAMGFDTALVVGQGVSSGLNLTQAMRQSGIVPNWVIHAV